MTDTFFVRMAPLLVVGVLTGCDGPTAPTSVAGPTTPAGTHTLAGTISETGAGPIGGVSLTTDRGKSAVTDEHGQYRIEGLSGHVGVALEKPGYEPYFGFGAIMDRDRVVDGAIQRTIQIAPGERTEITVFRDDHDYDLAYAWCPGPCKKIRTAGPGGTVISIRARARDESRSVCLLVDGGPPHFAMPNCRAAEVTATTTLFDAGGEFQIYVSFGDGYREGTQSVEVSVTLGTQP
jgi:hypothetical protein